MTNERFLKLINNPDLLASISFEELKTAALMYPYAHNLRYLLAIKAHQDGHPEAGRHLATAAAYSLNRRCLFALVAPKKLAPQAEPVLELKPIETVQRELEAMAPLARIPKKESEPVVESLAAPAPPPVPQEEKPPAYEGPVSPSQPPAVLLRAAFSTWITQFNTPALMRSKTEDPEMPPPSQTRRQPKPVKEPRSSDPQAPSAQMLAEKSVTENKDILSETLARLYVVQGYRDKAIAMYERLRLAFPDKSAYFAAEIDKLKK